MALVWGPRGPSSPRTREPRSPAAPGAPGARPHPDSTSGTGSASPRWTPAPSSSLRGSPAVPGVCSPGPGGQAGAAAPLWGQITSRRLGRGQASQASEPLRSPCSWGGRADSQLTSGVLLPLPPGSPAVCDHGRLRETRETQFSLEFVAFFFFFYPQFPPGGCVVRMRRRGWGWGGEPASATRAQWRRGRGRTTLPNAPEQRK